jgi:uncharacterized membrane protein YebE (DUF533 family)
MQRSRPQPKPSGLKGALGGATGALSGLARRQATPHRSRGKAKAGGGLAIMTAVAGLAFKNRDKLMAKAKQRGQHSSTPVDVSNSQPAAPPQP